MYTQQNVQWVALSASSFSLQALNSSPSFDKFLSIEILQINEYSFVQFGA